MKKSFTSPEKEIPSQMKKIFTSPEKEISSQMKKSFMSPEKEISSQNSGNPYVLSSMIYACHLNNYLNTCYAFN